MLLPRDIRDWLQVDHPARWVNDLVEDGLDLSAIYADYTEVPGAPPFDPRLMLKILIYGCSNGITSSGALERRCHDDLAFGFMTDQQAPDFVAISRFGTRAAKAFGELFTQALALCSQAGLVSLGRVALDGTKLRASASRHRAMSYDRMVRAEGELAAQVEALLADAQRLDAAEDAAYGADRRGDELPAELARREGRLAAIRTAKAALEAEQATKARAQAEQAATERGQDPGQVAAAGEAAQAAAVVPAKAQRSFTDPHTRVMKTSDGSFQYCFNAQTLVDERSQVVLTSALRQSGADCPALPEMLSALTTSLVAAGIEGTPRTLLAHAGYFSAGYFSAGHFSAGYVSADNITAVTEAGIDALIATGRRKHGAPIMSVPRGRIPQHLTPRQRMSRKLRTVKGKADYARCKAIVEPVFGQLKVSQGAGQFRLRGKDKVDGEWALHVLCHNLRKLRGAGWTPQIAI